MLFDPKTSLLVFLSTFFENSSCREDCTEETLPTSVVLSDTRFVMLFKIENVGVLYIANQSHGLTQYLHCLLFFSNRSVVVTNMITSDTSPCFSVTLGNDNIAGIVKKTVVISCPRFFH